MFNNIISKLAGEHPIRNGIIHALIISTIALIILFLPATDAKADLFSTNSFRNVDHPIVTWYTPNNPVVLNCLFVTDKHQNGTLGSYRMTLSSRLKQWAIVEDSCQYFKGTYDKSSGELIVFNVNNVGSALLTINPTKHFTLTKYNIW